MSTVETETAGEARKALEDVIRRGCLAAIYTSEEDRFSAGFVDAVSDIHVRLRSLDTAGRADGIGVRPLARIRRVETDDGYLVRRLAPLEVYWRNHRLWPEQRLVGHLPDLMLDTLTLSLEDRTVVTIFIGDAQYTGPVVKLASDAGTIVDLDQFGQRDGEFAFRIEDIDAVDFGSEHERRVQFLSRCGHGS